ncbi:hypothetical protein AB4563_16750 [Vibrio splendidus]|uniref:hypothetical protein n=1 Tax=Vibrio splendidus TaxID=29497 RepID=UPI00352DADF1
MASEPDFSTRKFDTDDKYKVRNVATAEDLEKLISLAENVSNNLHDMDSKASEIKQKSLWCVGIGYMFVGIAVVALTTVDFNSLGKVYELLIMGGMLVSVIPISILFVTMRRNLRRLLSDIKVEASVLQELLDMVHELENAGRYRSMIDPVSSIAFRMRLKRLHFSLD